jgi:hypothetical protein
MSTLSQLATQTHTQMQATLEVIRGLCKQNYENLVNLTELLIF